MPLLMSDQAIALITLAAVLGVGWAWFRLAYLGRPASSTAVERPASPLEVAALLALEVALVVIVLWLYVWFRRT